MFQRVFLFFIEAVGRLLNGFGVSKVDSEAAVVVSVVVHPDDYRCFVFLLKVVLLFVLVEDLFRILEVACR